MSRPDERRLVTRAAQGDEEAFEELVYAFHRPLFAFFYRTLMDREHAENLVQETFLRIHRYSRSYDERKPARSWIFGIAANLVKDFLSRRSSRPESPTGVPEVTAPPLTTDPEGAAVRTDVRRRVAKALMTLSDKHRTVFVLKHFHGMRYDEIAAAMETTVGTVKSRMHYACRELRRRLREPAQRGGPDDE